MRQDLPEMARPVYSQSLTHLQRIKCCGVAEIHLLSTASDPTKALQYLEDQLRYGITYPYDSKFSGGRQYVLFPFLFFTGVVGGADYKPDKDYATTFAKFITDNDFGELVTLPGQMNWTDNVIQMWLWAPKYDNVFAFLDKLKEKETSVPVETPIDNLEFRSANTAFTVSDFTLTNTEA